MNDTSTILCGYVVTRDNAESLALLHYDLVILKSTWLNPRHELLIVNAHEISTFTLPENLYWQLIAFLVLLWLEVSRKTTLCKYIDSLLVCVRIVALNCNIVNLRTYTESCV